MKWRGHVLCSGGMFSEVEGACLVKWRGYIFGGVEEACLVK